MIDIDRAELLDSSRPTDPDEMRTLAARLTGQYLRKHQRVILLLSGEPGAGKTTFCQAFRDLLELDDRITSPTFNILNEYRGKTGDLYHYDLYRLRAGDELLDLDFLERWDRAAPARAGSSAARFEIHAVEWWERAREHFPVALPTYLLEITSLFPDETAEFDPESEPRETRFYRLPAAGRPGRPSGRPGRPV